MKKAALLVLTLLVGCGGKDTLIGVIPARNPPATGPGFPLAPYQETLDTLYLKVWSDSSWSKYGGDTTFGTATYYVMKDNWGDEFYYGDSGYAGFCYAGQSPVLFDTPLGSWPDSLPINGLIYQSTTFTFQGTSWTMYVTYLLADTSADSTIFGRFDPCLHFQSVSTVEVAGTGGSTYVELWLANGPGEIEEADQQGNSLFMVRGHVNGRYWGTGAAKMTGAVRLSKRSSTPGPVDIVRVASSGLNARIGKPGGY
jgi:hypothetical protein